MAGLVLIIGYFLPALIGFSRKHHQAHAIMALDLFLGWTFVGWVLALVWALTATPARPVAERLR
jgi:hypothetical protein